jgi:GntR family transcriptional regulator
MPRRHRRASTANIADRLRIAIGTPVVRRINWYWADGEPIQIGTTHVPADVAGTSPIATGDALPPVASTPALRLLAI